MAVHVIMLGEFDLILGNSITANNGDDEGATCVRYQLRPEALDQGYTGTLLRRSLRDVQQDEEEMRLELYVNNSDQRYLFKGYAQPPPNKLNDYFLIFDPATNKFTLERLKHNYVLQTPCRNEPFITTAPPPPSSKIAPSLPFSTPPLPASSPPPPPPLTSSSPSPVASEIKQDYSSFVSEGEVEEEREEVNDEATKLEPDIDAVLEAAWDSSSPAPSPSAPEFEPEVAPKLDLEPEDFSSSPPSSSSSSSSSSPSSMVEEFVPKSSKTPAAPTIPAAAIQAVSTPVVAAVAMTTPATAPQKSATTAATATKKPIKAPTSPLKPKSEKDGKSLLSLRQRLGILQKPDMYEDEGSSATTASSTSSSSEESSSDEEEEEEE